MNQSKTDLDAREAAALLGVKLPTLYAYVSRGLLRSVAEPGGRARRYPRAEVEALRARRRAGGAEAALRWGEPLLETSISAMGPEGPSYRGRLALELARADTPFESVAELLWGGALPARRPTWPVADAFDVRALTPLASDVPPSAWHPVVVSVLAARDPGRFDNRPEAVLPRARALVRALAASLALGVDPRRAAQAAKAPTVAEALARAAGVAPARPALRLLEQALVLVADHELNASTFAARVVASTHADIYAAVLAGLAALSGPLHGAMTDRVEALLAEVLAVADAERAIHERDRRGEAIPGFGHPFYPQGDPRAALLLERSARAGRKSEELARLAAVLRAMDALGRPPPNVDTALVAVRAALGMPRGSAGVLFAVGRCAGWIAHALEQYAAGLPFRPRARYRASP